MGFKRAQKKTSSASQQKKAKYQDSDDETKSVKGGRARASKKSYYESDNSCLDDSDADPDFDGKTSKKKQHKRKMASESDDESSSDDEILANSKRSKPRAKKKGVGAKKRKSKKESVDSGNSSDESEAERKKSPLSGNYQPFLSSEGSDSDVPIVKSSTKKAKTPESGLSTHEFVETKEPVTSLKLVNKNMGANKNMLKSKDVDIKTDFESKPVWKKENLEDSEEEDMKEIKMEVKIEHYDEPNAAKKGKDSQRTKSSVKEKMNSKKSVANRKGKVQLQAFKCEDEEFIEEVKIESSAKEKIDKKSAAAKKGKARSKVAKHVEEMEEDDTKERSKAKLSKKNSKSKSTKSAVVEKRKKSTKLKNLDDVSAVLMQFEGKKSGNKILSSDSEESEVAAAQNSSESDWEEVEDDPSVTSTSSGKPQQTIEITLEQNQFVKRKKKVGNFDMAAHFRRLMNVFQRDLRIVTHKVHLLCLIGHGMTLNRLCCDPMLKALSFSIIPAVNGKSDFTVGKVKSLLTTFSTSVQITPQENDAESPTYFSIVKAFHNYEAKGSKEYTMMVVMALRSLGLMVRLVMSFHPVPLKEPKVEKKKTTNTSKLKNNQKEKTSVQKSECNKDTKLTKKEKKETKGKKESKVVKSTQKKMAAQKKPHLIDDDDSTTKNRPNRRKSKTISYKESDGSDFEDENEVPEKKLKSQKNTLSSKVSEKMASSPSYLSSDDFEEDSLKSPTSKRTAPKPGHKIISSSSSNSSLCANSQDNVTETWIEVYLEKEKRWLSVDCVNLVCDDLPHFEKLDSQPFSYILTFDNDGYLKDVTARYASQWMLKTRKLRVEDEWWAKTTKPYLRKDEENKREDNLIQDNLLKQPLPKTISEYKNHPFYALQRHLLKFEAIYPNSAVPLGYLKNEPIYARECVHQLHARETWLKEGRSVKLGEEPYKMVKSRPKWNKPKENPDVPDLPVFGRWQTEVYVPPPAVDGKIPRNEYGNVELYKPTMLPAGTVHLKESGLNKVARKLGVDCAAAMVGWDFHGGSSHPVFDGWVVCVENKDMILKEWEKEQQRSMLREIEKREKRVYGNWKKLIRGLLIRERLKKKYDLMEPGFVEAEQEDDTQAGRKENEKTTKSTQGKKKNSCKS